MHLRSSVVALAALASVVTARNTGPKDFCCALTSAITRLHEQSAATSFCSSFLSITTKTTTTQKTATSSVSKAAPVTTTKTVTPTTTVTTTLTRTTASGTKASYTTIPTSVTLTSTSTVTAVVTSFTTSTSTTTSTQTSTSVSTTTSTTTTTTFTTTTSSELDPNFQCFTTSSPQRKAKRGLLDNIGPLGFLNGVKGIIPKEITSACDCLSLTTPTKTLTNTVTVVKTASYPTTATATVTAKPSTVTATSTQYVTTPATTSASTAFSTGTALFTTTTTASSTSVVTSITTTTVVTSTITTSVTTTFSTSTSTSTATFTTALGTDLVFRLATHNGAASSGPEIVVAPTLSGAPFDYYFWRTQHSGATTFRLDDQCQLESTIVDGVYALQHPSDPNPGRVYSGSGAPVTCEMDIDTQDVTCSNPDGGSTSWLCSQDFGANTYVVWYLGQDNRPGSRCDAHAMYAAYTL